ncbi:MAG TPA: tautomerase family protein [Galbitalea sp.]
MPHVHIDMHQRRRPQMHDISAALHKSLVDGLVMPEDDLFQIFTLHDDGELVFSRTFPEADRDDIIYIEVLASEGYSPETKAAMYAAMVENTTALGIRADTLLISIIEIDGRANWHSPAKPAA